MRLWRLTGDAPEESFPFGVDTTSAADGRFTLPPSRPGRYRVVCRAVDTTKLRGEKWPWVLSDPHHLLQSERAWWVRVAE